MSVSSYATAASLENLANPAEASENQDEYETQYFGFTPKSFSNGMYNAVNEYMRDGLEAVETYINTEYGNVMSPDQVSEGVQKMQQRIAQQVDKAFDTLEVYLFSNIFCIPANSVLPEDEVKQEKAYTAQDETRINTEIKELTDKILAVKYANTCLQRELETIDTAQKQMDTMLSQAQNMNTVVKNAGVTDVKDALVFGSSKTLKRLEILKNIKVVPMSQTDETKAQEKE